MKKLLILFYSLTSILFSEQLTSKPDTLFKSNFQISNQIISKDNNGRLYLAFTGQSGSNPSSREIYYAIQEKDSFLIQKITNNYSEEITSSLFISEDNKLHIIFLSRDDENLMQLYYMNNVSGKFSKRIQLTKTPVSKIAPKAVMDRSGRIHIVYFTNSFTDNHIFYKSFSTSNFTVSNDLVLCEGSTDNDNDADITLDQQSKVHIVVKSGSVTEGKLKYFSNIKGLMKESDLKITHNICSPKIIFNGKILNIFYKNSEDQRLYWVIKKRDFTSPKVITPEVHNPIGIRNCCIDESNRIYFIYQNLESSDLKSIYLMHFNTDEHSAPVKIASIKDNSLLGDVSLTAGNDGSVSFLTSAYLRKDLNASANLIYAKNYVFGNAQMKSSSNVIDFGDQFIDDTSLKNIRIFNEGSTILKLFNPVSSDNSFSVEILDTLIVLPDSSEDLTVSFTPSAITDYEASLTLETNAVNNKKLSIKLSGSGLGYPIIMTDRDTVFVYDPKQFSDSLLITNTGTATLSVDSVTVSNTEIKIAVHPFTLNPGDSVYFPVTINQKKRTGQVTIADTIYIYSNDLYEEVRYIFLQSISIAKSESDEDEIASEYELLQNYPNPFNPSTTISFSISHPAYINLAVYDAVAREIAELADGYYAAGVHNVNFTAQDISTGIYYYKLRVKSGEKKIPDYVEVRKMVLIK